MNLPKLRGLLPLLLFLSLSVPALAQTALTGTVADQTGGVLPGVDIMLVNAATGVTRTTAAGDDGTYTFQQLDPGSYRIEFSLEGFKTLVQENLVIPVGITTTFDAAMQLGNIQEQVIVSAASSTLNTSDASLGNVMTGVQVLNLPSESLDPAGLLSLQPGVTFVASGADQVGGYSGIIDTDGRTGSVNGARSDQTNITLDGVDVNDPENGYAFTSALRATQASLQEFRVTTSNYNSELGRSSSAQVQLVTKSGTNELHGEVYYTHRNDGLAANEFFNNLDGVQKGKLRRHIYGAALGGPIVKDRLFMFGNFERLEHLEEASVLRTVPADSFRDGVLIYGCADPAQCPGGTVQGISGAGYSVPAGFRGLNASELSEIDPLGIGPNSGILSYFDQFPRANAVGGFDGINLLGFRFNSPIDNDFKTYIARLDFNIDQNGNHTLFARGTLQDDAIVSKPPAYPGRPPNQLMLGNSKGMAVGYKAIMSPTMINAVRYGYTRIGESLSGIKSGEFNDLRFIDEIHGMDGSGSISGDAGASVSTRTRKLPQHHFRDDMSIVMGRHTFGFGTDLRFTRNDRTNNVNSFSLYQVNPSWLGGVGRALTPGAIECVTCGGFPAVDSGFVGSYRDSVVNMLGIMTQMDANYNYLTDGSILPPGTPVARLFAVDEYEFYFQDQWRVMPDVTFTYGVRWGVSSPPWEVNGQQVVPTPNLGDWFETRRSLMLSGQSTSRAPTLAFDLAGPANGGRDYFSWDWNNWSPRLAVAWAPNYTEGILGAISGGGKLSLRAGYSLVYDRLGNGLASNFDSNGSFGMSTMLTSTFGGCDEGAGESPLGICPRFTTPFDVEPSQRILPAAPKGGFPAIPPGADAFGVLMPGAFSISEALDSSITTPYSHVFNVSLQREFGDGYTIEAAYVGRRGRDLLISRDMAMPADLVDPASGVSYFTAAKELIGLMEKGVDINNVGPISYWENLFPSFGPDGINGGQLPCGVVPGSGDGVYSATQVAYDYMNCNHPDTSAFPYAVDLYAYPGYATCADGVDIDGDGILDCPFAMFGAQFSALNALSSIARSEYHAMQISLRKRFSQGLALQMNYTLSHALDHSSQPERASVFGDFGGGGTTGTTINAWDLEQEYGNADFDMRHQFNANWYWQLPFGQGRRFGSSWSGIADSILGGWEVSGIVRINSGQVANVGNDRVWPTNWQLTGNATCAGRVVDDQMYSTAYGPCPDTQNARSVAGRRGPNMFSDPEQAYGEFRFSLPGDRGDRNVLRGDNYFSMDFAVGKQFNMPWEGHSVKFRWEVFNLTNSAYFNTNDMNLTIGSRGVFGDYVSTLGSPRRMQVGLRYEF